MRIKALNRLFDKYINKKAEKKINDLKNHYELLIESINNTHDKTVKSIMTDADERVSTMEALTETQIRKLEKAHANEILILNKSHIKNRESLQDQTKRFSSSNDILFEIDQLYRSHVQNLYTELDRRKKASEDLIADLIRSNSSIDDLTKEFETKLKALRRRLSNKLNIGEE